MRKEMTGEIEEEGRKNMENTKVRGRKLAREERKGEKGCEMKRKESKIRQSDLKQGKRKERRKGKKRG